ncbi:MAG: sodium/proline symporter [Gemmatimonadota bacterium]|nr:sodium/proline symporter [Gemmatimonadota bacterium]
MTSPVIIAVLAVYLVLLLAIGIWGGRESHDVEGYYAAGKKLPSWVLAFSSNATGESAWLLLGLTGMGYAVGMHALWVVAGEVLGVALAWTFVARPFKAYTDRYRSITVPDYLEDRFRDTSHTFRYLGAVIILSMVAAYTAAQLTATGKAFDSFLGTGYEAGVLIGLAVILFYTTVGGFKAVAYSDFVQGVLMLGCLFALPLVGIAAVGGWDAFVAGLRAAEPLALFGGQQAAGMDLLLPGGGLGLTPEGIASAAGFLGIGLAFLGAPQLLGRFLAARDQREIVRAGPIAVGCIIVFDLGAVFAGMAGRVLFPGLADPETIMPAMASELFPAVFTGLFLVVVLAAIMSTVDSVLILASSSVVRDLVQKVFRPGATQRALSRLGKLVTVVLGLIGLALALAEVRLIFWFVLFAWSGLASAFTPVVLCSLFWARTTRAGAIAGMVAGFVVTVVWVVWLKEGFYDLYEMLPGFAAGFLCTIGVSLLTEPPEGAAEEMAEIRSELGSALRPR